MQRVASVQYSRSPKALFDAETMIPRTLHKTCDRSALPSSVPNRLAQNERNPRATEIAIRPSQPQMSALSIGGICPQARQLRTSVEAISECTTWPNDAYGTAWQSLSAFRPDRSPPPPPEQIPDCRPRPVSRNRVRPLSPLADCRPPFTLRSPAGSAPVHRHPSTRVRRGRTRD